MLADKGGDQTVSNMNSETTLMGLRQVQKMQNSGETIILRLFLYTYFITYIVAEYLSKAVSCKM